MVCGQSSSVWEKNQVHTTTIYVGKHFNVFGISSVNFEIPSSGEFLHALLSRKSTFCQKVTRHKDKKIPFISNLKKPTCTSKRDMLKL